MSVVAGDEILLRGEALFLVCNQMDANAIGAVFGETIEVALTRQGGVQIVGFSDVDIFMAGTAQIGLVVETALGHEKYRTQRLEPRRQRPCVEVVFLPRLAGEKNTSVSCDARLRL